MLTAHSPHVRFVPGKRYTYSYTPGDSVLRLSGGCQQPAYVHLRRARLGVTNWEVPYVAPPGLTYPSGPGTIKGIGLKVRSTVSDVELLAVRCRRCPSCIHRDKMEWVERAQAETKAAKFTLLATMTFSEQWFARKWREENGHDIGLTWDDVQPPDLERRDRAEISKWLLSEFSLWCKRVRKSGRKFRYMAVVEYGKKRGRPHIHFLYHSQCTEDFDTLIAALKAQSEHFPGCSCAAGENCRIGWLDCEPLRDDGGIHYVAKYMRKSWDNDEGGISLERCRVRASLKYGRRTPSSIIGPADNGSHNYCGSLPHVTSFPLPHHLGGEELSADREAADDCRAPKAASRQTMTAPESVIQNGKELVYRAVSRSDGRTCTNRGSEANGGRRATGKGPDRARSVQKGPPE